MNDLHKRIENELAREPGMSRSRTVLLLALAALLLWSATVTIDSADLVVCPDGTGDADSYRLELRGSSTGGSRSFRFKNQVWDSNDYRLLLQDNGFGEILSVTDDGDVRTSMIDSVAVVHASGKYPTIQSAINAVSARGGKVYIPAGVYNEDLIDLVIGDITLEGAGPATVIQSGNAANYLIRSGAFSTVKIRGIRFRYTVAVSASTQVGVHLAPDAGGLDYEDVTIEDCLFENCYHGVLVDSSATSNGKRVRIARNHFVGCMESVTTDGTADAQDYLTIVTVTDNIIDPGNLALSVGIHNDLARRVLVTSNVVIDANMTGIYSTGARSSITGNLVYSGKAGIQNFATGRYSAITGNLVDSPGFVGIDNFGLAVAITGNQVCLGSGVGIDSSGVATAVSGNGLAKNGDHGLLVSGDGSAVFGNAVYDCGDAVDEHGVECTGSNMTISGNAVYYSASPAGALDGILSTGGSCTIAGNTSHDASDDGIESTGPGCTLFANAVYSPGDDGIAISGGQTAVVGNAIDGPSGTGVLAGADQVAVVGNGIDSPGEYGVYNSGAGSTISANRVNASTLEGVYNTAAGDRSTITGNVIDDPGADGIENLGDSVAISSNMIYKADHDGVLSSGYHAAISGNVIEDAGDDGSGNGINATFDLVSITGNVVLDSPDSGIQVDSENEYVIAGNVIDDAGDIGINIKPMSNRGAIGGNLVRDALNACIQVQGDSVSVTGNVASANGTAQTTDKGLIVRGGSDGVAMAGNVVDGNSGESGAGIRLRNGVQYSTFVGNLLDGNDYGFHSQGMSYSTAAGNCVVNPTSGFGGFVLSDTEAVHDANALVGNHVECGSTVSNGIRLQGDADGNLIAGNSLDDPTGNGIFLEALSGTQLVVDTLVASNLTSSCVYGVEILGWDAANKNTRTAVYGHADVSTGTAGVRYTNVDNLVIGSNYVQGATNTSNGGNSTNVVTHDNN